LSLFYNILYINIIYYNLSNSTLFLVREHSMKSLRIVTVGGCHVAGYGVDSEQSFPVLLAKLLDGEVVGQTAHARFVDLPYHLEPLLTQQPSHVVMQVGNYEFSASWYRLLRQLKLKRWAKRPPEEQPSAALGHRRTVSLATYSQVAVMSLLMTALWLFSAPHRRSFQTLKRCMQQHPATTFIFLSPFPDLNPGDDMLRRFGGWLLRHRLSRRPNLHWVDSHQLLRTDAQLYVDSSHLNSQGHRALSYGLAACVLRNTVLAT
jgi:hypothetical protein